MRMKLNRTSQLAIVAAASLLAATLITACSQLTQTLTVDFVYVLSSKAAGANQYGEINVFEINSESGRMRQIPTSPFPSAGRNPVAEAVSADYQNLFVVNQDDNTLVQFVIGTDGKLYPFYTVNTPGIYPLAVAANKSNVFVVNLYEPLPLCSSAEPCPGSISVFPISAGGSSSSAPCTATVCLDPPAVNSALNGTYWPLALSCSPTDVVAPSAVNVLASGAYVYVTAYDSTAAADDAAGTPNPCDRTSSPSSAPTGYVFGFWVVPASYTSIPSGASCPPLPPGETTFPAGTLCPLADSPFAAGVQPSAIASDSTSTYVYVTDFTSGNVRGYNAASGNLTPLSGSPYPAGNQPTGIVVDPDPSYPYAYVTNSLDATVQAYSISNGSLSSIGDYATGLDPIAIGIDPSTNHFLFTLNFLDNTVSGFELSISNGTLLDSQNSPYTTAAQPTGVAAIPHNGTGSGVEQ
jgi:6-phosphogluconolactonase